MIADVWRTTQTFLVIRTIICVVVLSSTYSSVRADESTALSAYDLFETSFTVPVSYNNPFDFADIQVDAEIRRREGEAVVVPCFFDGDAWRLRYTPSKDGQYDYRIVAKTPSETKVAASGSFAANKADRRGFLRVGSHTNRYFAFDSGEPYFALGENIGWVRWRGEANVEAWVGYLDECSAVGMNWIRIWMCPWGRTELTWTPMGVSYKDYKTYDMNNACVIDGIFREAEKRGVYIQWCINHHGQYSKQTNPIWDGNPFSVENGGFLKEPEDFFTDREAIRHYKNRLRYLVARWGYSTHLMAWEFWNEVNLTSNFDFPTVKRWHEEMAQYLHEIDPYDHLLTTSTSGGYEQTCEIEGLDYLQSHSYTNHLIAKLAETSQKREGKCSQVPHFFGEMAYDWRGPAKVDPTGISLHNQLWASVHATSDAGTAMTWWWDNWIRPNNLYPIFLPLAKYIEEIDWDRDDLKPMAAVVEPKDGNRGPLLFVPKIEWGNTTRSQFSIDSLGNVDGLGECTQFIHGDGHRDMAPNPIFQVNFDRSVEFVCQIDRISMNGADCSIELDGVKVFQRAFAPGEKDSTMGRDGRVSFVVPAGRHEIRINNTGPDWYKIGHYSIGDLVQRPQAFARGNNERVLLWVHDRLHQGRPAFELSTARSVGKYDADIARTRGRRVYYRTVRSPYGRIGRFVVDSSGRKWIGDTDPIV